MAIPKYAETFLNISALTVSSVQADVCVPVRLKFSHGASDDKATSFTIFQASVSAGEGRHFATASAWAVRKERP